MDLTRITSLLDESLGSEKVIVNAEMKDYCSFRLGGRAKLLVICDTMDDLRYALYVVRGADALMDGGDCSGCTGCAGSGCDKQAECDGCKAASDCCSSAGTDGPVPYMVIGNGSNILVKDGGYDGVIIKLGRDFCNIDIDGTTVTAGAGALLSTVAKMAAQANLTGMEAVSGIPGSIGGACFMNAGAYDGEMKQIIRYAKCISADGLREYIIEKDDMDLSYRHSIMEDTGAIVTEVVLDLAVGDPSEIKAKMDDYTERRTTKQPLKYPSAGSFFKRPTGHFAGALIEGAGLKGIMVGGAQVSDLHAGFVINKDNGTATDVIRLMHLVQNTVFDKTGVMLEPEVRIIGNDAE